MSTDRPAGPILSQTVGAATGQTICTTAEADRDTTVDAAGNSTVDVADDDREATSASAAGPVAGTDRSPDEAPPPGPPAHGPAPEAVGGANRGDGRGTGHRAGSGPARLLRAGWADATGWRVIVNPLPALGVLIPALVMLRYSVISVPSFDGGMNLEVARNLANGLGYGRNYAGFTIFPPEIQTSGFYIVLAAACLWLFGASTFVYSLPNLILIVVLLVATSMALRRWRWLQILGPSIALFAVPRMADLAMHGYGEYVVAALVVMAFVLIARSAGEQAPAIRNTAVAWLLIGLALTTKTVAALAVPVLVIGVVLVALARPQLRRWRLAATTSVVLVPLILVEILRLASLGSFTAYASYWSLQVRMIASQAGVSDAPVFGFAGTSPKVGLIRKIGDHVHLLSVSTGIGAALLLVIIALPFLVLLGLFVGRRMGWREWLRRPGAVLAVQLAVYAGGYFVWWLAITPTEKAFLRRIAIGLVALVLLYLVVVGLVVDHLRVRRPAAERNGRARAVAAVAWLLAAALAVMAIVPLARILGTQVRLAMTTSDAQEQQIKDLSAVATGIHRSGGQLYGDGWWSAPVIALYAGNLPVGNLQKVQVCTDKNLAAGKAYLVWDFYAENISSKKPQGHGLTYTPVPDGSNPWGGTIYHLGIAPGTCPTG